MMTEWFNIQPVWMMLMIVDDGVVQYSASVWMMLMIVDDSEWFNIQPVCG